MNAPESRKILGRTYQEWFSSPPGFCLLLLTLLIGTGGFVHGQLLRFGESMFGDSAAQVQYFMLRAEPSKPDCNPDLNLDQELQRLQAEHSSGSKDDDIDDLFGDSSAASDPTVLRKSLEQAQAICKAKFDL